VTRPARSADLAAVTAARADDAIFFFSFSLPPAFGLLWVAGEFASLFSRSCSSC
jgi:hypothetical protein